ncbi:galectin-4-like isoform X4 [Cyprinodon tularosa]|uniref:galectin-4-like isoform X4 n=1 Tax=Cyprinodon tularosa TaxID=77115 RepID=UPI0018E210DD|nr:galectin-4-like isoform X4 [Cyprinodon tularosa]
MTFVAPPGYQPVYNPRIPYLGPIYGGLREGVSIYIQGSVPEDITRFLINLLSEESESGDIALHFNPRFDGWDKVVFNSRTNGSWGSEEKIRRMPFSKGEAFELVIMITSEGFQTNVNGKEFFMFPHRIPVERVRAIQVAGDVSIQTINIIGGSGGGTGPGGMGGGYPVGGMGGGYPGGGMGGGYPGGGMGGGCPDGTGGGKGGYPGGPGGNMAGGFPGSHLPGMGGQPVYNPTVPYYAMIPGGMCPKRTIIIRGMVPYAAKRMGFNLVVSRSRDIAFHMNPRVKEGVVVRNTRIGEKWGKEERELTTNPFVEGQYFDMSIRCGNQRFKVFVNGQHLFDFSHRISFNEIDKLEIEGEVQISYIHF